MINNGVENIGLFTPFRSCLVRDFVLLTELLIVKGGRLLSLVKYKVPFLVVIQVLKLPIFKGRIDRLDLCSVVGWN